MNVGAVGLHRPKKVPTNTKWQFASNTQQEQNDQEWHCTGSFVVNLDRCGADRVAGGERWFECVINTTFVLYRHTVRTIWSHYYNKMLKLGNPSMPKVHRLFFFSINKEIKHIFNLCFASINWTKWQSKKSLELITLYKPWKPVCISNRCLYFFF